MAWVYLDDNFPNHPKAVTAGAVARDLFVCGLCYCRRFHTGGFLPLAAIRTLGAVNAKRSADVLVKVGLWELTEGGYQVHDYHEMYEDMAEKAAKAEIRELRREAGRKGGLSRASISKQNTRFASSTDGIGLGVSSDLLLEEKKREADFETFWQIYPRHDGKQAARVEWVKLNPDLDTQRVIRVDLERRSRSAQWLKDGGQFIPHARTYLHQKRWEDGFTERPRLSERTVNVIKGFEDPAEVA